MRGMQQIHERRCSGQTRSKVNVVAYMQNAVWCKTNTELLMPLKTLWHMVVGALCCGTGSYIQDNLGRRPANKVRLGGGSPSSRTTTLNTQQELRRNASDQNTLVLKWHFVLVYQIKSIKRCSSNMTTCERRRTVLEDILRKVDLAES
ncbi:hypothetical protein XENORESO_008068 [Xenotaenia resolanae]|uniref:Uncharacterized protein n=1 Tax=Xenotaenia resolanae TaxID=208358 RepID=A0ABV0W125_9TELE